MNLIDKFQKANESYGLSTFLVLVGALASILIKF